MYTGSIQQCPEVQSPWCIRQLWSTVKMYRPDKVAIKFLQYRVYNTSQPCSNCIIVHIKIKSSSVRKCQAHAWFISQFWSIVEMYGPDKVAIKLLQYVAIQQFYMDMKIKSSSVMKCQAQWINYQLWSIMEMYRTDQVYSNTFYNVSYNIDSHTAIVHVYQLIQLNLEVPSPVIYQLALVYGFDMQRCSNNFYNGMVCNKVNSHIATAIVHHMPSLVLIIRFRRQCK